MLKRPLNPRFSQAVRDGIKVTTMRENPWPVGTPIMLYNWSGRAYRSKQINVAEIIVLKTSVVTITRTVLGMGYWEKSNDSFLDSLWKTEGFPSQKDMDEWFAKLVKHGQSLDRHLMTFSQNVKAEAFGTAPQDSNT